MRRRNVPPETQAQWTAKSKARLAELKASGKKLGRPSCSPVDLEGARQQVIEGRSQRDAALMFGISYHSLWRYLKTHPLPGEPD